MENHEITLQVGVKVLLKNFAGKYLLLRRNPEKYPDVPAAWDIVGGRIEPGTPLLENLKREVFEETKLVLSDAPKLVAAQDININGQTDKRHVVRLTYTASIEGSPIIGEEHQEAKWFSAEEISNFDAKILDPYFRDLLDKKILEL